MGRTECKHIGIYSSIENAEAAIELLKTKNGFKDTMNGFQIAKELQVMRPFILDRTYWIDGFDTC